LNFIFFNNFLFLFIFYQGSTWGLGIGDWGLGIGDWGFGPIPQTPTPKPKINKII